MRTVTDRFDDYLVNWIISCAQRNRISISEFIRNLLYKKMIQVQIETHIFKINKAKKQPVSPNYHNELGYIIFAAKLIEKFVLTTQEQGEELRNAAFQEAKDSLSQLNLNNKNKEQRFCFNLEEPIYLWLSNESSRLQVVTSHLIRSIIEDIYLEEHMIVDHQVSELQKNSMEHQIIACKLLEILVSHTVSGGEDIVAQARYSAKETIAKLYHRNKALVSA
ncbi:MAG: hypothetical protein ACR2HS_01120 [Gammaproteobacteria bacterium]